jgi:hypothetical protein
MLKTMPLGVPPNAVSKSMKKSDNGVCDFLCYFKKSSGFIKDTARTSLFVHVNGLLELVVENDKVHLRLQRD